MASSVHQLFDNHSVVSKSILSLSAAAGLWLATRWILNSRNGIKSKEDLVRFLDGYQELLTISSHTSDIVFLYPLGTQLNVLEDNIRLVESRTGSGDCILGAALSGASVSVVVHSDGLLLLVPTLYKLAFQSVPIVLYVPSFRINDENTRISVDYSVLKSPHSTAGAHFVLCDNIEELETLSAVVKVVSKLARSHFVLLLDFKSSTQIFSTNKKVTDYKESNDIDRVVRHLEEESKTSSLSTFELLSLVSTHFNGGQNHSFPFELKGTIKPSQIYTLIISFSYTKEIEEVIQHLNSLDDSTTYQLLKVTAIQPSSTLWWDINSLSSALQNTGLSSANYDTKKIVVLDPQDLNEDGLNRTSVYHKITTLLRHTTFKDVQVVSYTIDNEFEYENLLSKHQNINQTLSNLLLFDSHRQLQNNSSAAALEKFSLADFQNTKYNSNVEISNVLNPTLLDISNKFVPDLFQVSFWNKDYSIQTFSKENPNNHNHDHNHHLNSLPIIKSVAETLINLNNQVDPNKRASISTINNHLDYYNVPKSGLNDDLHGLDYTSLSVKNLSNIQTTSSTFAFTSITESSRVDIHNTTEASARSSLFFLDDVSSVTTIHTKTSTQKEDEDGLNLIDEGQFSQMQLDLPKTTQIICNLRNTTSTFYLINFHQLNHEVEEISRATVGDHRHIDAHEFTNILWGSVFSLLVSISNHKSCHPQDKTLVQTIADLTTFKAHKLTIFFEKYVDGKYFQSEKMFQRLFDKVVKNTNIIIPTSLVKGLQNEPLKVEETSKSFFLSRALLPRESAISQRNKKQGDNNVKLLPSFQSNLLAIFPNEFSGSAGTIEKKNYVAQKSQKKDQIFTIKLTKFVRLTPDHYDRNIFHMELDISGTGLKYEMGEALAVYPHNEDQQVEEFLRWYNVDPETIVQRPTSTNNTKQKDRLVNQYSVRTLFQVFAQELDIFGKPSKSFYSELSKYAASTSERQQLEYLGGVKVPEGNQLSVESLLKEYTEETLTYFDILKLYPSAKPSINTLIQLIPPMKSRHYSIASSMKMHPDSVHLLVVVEDWKTPKGVYRQGLCSSYLSRLTDPQSRDIYLTVSVAPSLMKLPPNHQQPIIMAGLGTGMAPFRAFIQERAYFAQKGEKVGEVVLYFGSRHRSSEYLYGEELEAFEKAGILTTLQLAFSRDQKEKVYIQHKLKSDSQLLYDLIHPKNGHFYLCGPKWPAGDVHDALLYSLTTAGKLSNEEAKSYLHKMKETGRYVLEVY
eukprot:TRINITY_DN800_c0_g1_i1.p1 TRINITY_DN800_c0_g1~~TRINITY_DN800_c0_g1_i1.p1  ORF type:complete len:1247 (-),score=196.48 TRINITY_DN800_c0_g1_i1:19-3759(-)